MAAKQKRRATRGKGPSDARGNRGSPPHTEDASPQRLPPNPQPRRRLLLAAALVAFVLWFGYLTYVASTRW